MIWPCRAPEAPSPVSLTQCLHNTPITADVLPNRGLAVPRGSHRQELFELGRDRLGTWKLTIGVGKRRPQGLPLNAGVVPLFEPLDELRKFHILGNLRIDTGQEGAPLFPQAVGGEHEPSGSGESIERGDRGIRIFGTSSTKPAVGWPSSCSRYSTRCSTLAGNCVVGRHADSASVSSGRLPLTVTPIGRVCGTGIGIALSHVTEATPNVPMRCSTAATKRSHWKSGSYPLSRRNGCPMSSCASSRPSRDGWYSVRWVSVKIITGRRAR